MLSWFPAVSYAREDADHVYSSSAPAPYDAIRAGVSADKQGTVTTMSYVSSSGSSVTVGIYLPYYYDASDTSKAYNVIILLQGQDKNPSTDEYQKRPTKFLNNEKGKQVFDYLFANDLVEPFIFAEITERDAVNAPNIGNLINALQSTYNVYGARFVPEDEVRNHWAAIGFSSGASYMNSKVIRYYASSFAWYGICSQPGGSGDASPFENSGLRMKLLFTSSGTGSQEEYASSPWFERKSLSTAQKHQQIYGDYADQSVRWIFDGMLHGDWKNTWGAVYQFSQICFRGISGSVGTYDPYAIPLTAMGELTAYTDDVKLTLGSFAAEYGWNTSYLKAASWPGLDSATYERSSSHQLEAYKDMYDAAVEDLVAAGLLSPMMGGGIGFSIAAVAKAEASAPDNTEVPLGSQNVKYNTWYYGHPCYKAANDPNPNTYAWCCVFVVWCAAQCGLLDSGVFTKTAGVRNMHNYLVKDTGCLEYPARSISQLGGGGYTACVGDIFIFQGNAHIGIVTEVSENSIEVTQGNTADTVKSITYTSRSLRDPWVGTGWIIHVNYPSDEFTIFNFLKSEFGFNGAVASGIMANMWTESHWNPHALGDGGTSYGLCQWHNTRWDNLKRFCDNNGYDWETIEGQLYFLREELSARGYADMMAQLQSYPDDATGAYKAAKDFCDTFERPANPNSGNMRGANAQRIFYPMFCLGDETEFLKICGSYRQKTS